jgi:dTDP-4-amino-4,6-dideoxygalactose transaminase
MIPVNEPLFKGNEKKYLNQCIDDGWISSEGPFVKEFEEKFSSYIGVKYGSQSVTAPQRLKLLCLEFASKKATR